MASAQPAVNPSASHGTATTTATTLPTRPAPASGGTPSGPNPSATPGPAPVLASAPIPGTAATAATHGQAPDVARNSVSPADQVVRALGPLRTLASGSRSVTLALEPDGLGTVRATVVAGAGTLSVTLQAASPQGYEALRQGLGQLHHELGTLASKVQIDLRQEGQGSGSGSQQAPGRGPGSPATTKPVTPELPPEVTGTGPSSPMGGRLVDLRL
ncbi:flagellar hook-length control protein FliK [Aciditerrimonas ferrireducens]|uniref:flagellar hook-length control protein FliK n=1 Tax=Aciditerrimonas ferrireducens TaxID=667306 RepID=UPI002006A7C1|nr:flagellar hook-length control protein FliK [Aciditerrimonas ferrireducens]MCK4177621.1 flagellar hook-length control protein FliK [Aciditerrimonas ferrireducens]